MREAIVADKIRSATGMTSRRQAIGVMGTAISAGVVGAAAPALAATAKKPLREPTPPPALVPRGDLVNVLEYEAQARLVLGPAKVAPILGSDRTVTDRITLRPRMNVPTRDLDLTSILFGDAHFAPIIVGPIADQKRFHPEGEIATARGASAAKAAMVVSSDASAPLAMIAQAAATPLWLQVYANSPKLKDRLAEAHAAKAKAVIVTVNAGASAHGPTKPASARIDWAAVDAVVKGTHLPVIVKGVTRPQDAKEAVARGAKGVVVSNYRGGDAAALTGTLLLVAPVVQAVGDQVPVLVDGSFRRGTDILKALAHGAKGVLIGRPVMWGLAAYGADGVQGVVEMLQTELARYMCMCGRPTLAALDPGVVHVHAPLPTESHHHG
ncbi:MAG TPA: alpha-hydroxy-acid oxidizing protein [Caulobacteraceae bacterium]|nr:alpha-hydroxy-acid oxidizing protein [Caulobacteraceae bacterium]